MGRRDPVQRLISEIEIMGVTDRRILDAVGRVPRDSFVAEEQKRNAWANRPLPIGLGQTISQPYTVAYMMELVGIQSGDFILEVGGGCGYAAAIASVLTGSDGEVWSVEIRETLAEKARNTLGRLEIANVHVVVGDGKEGYPSSAPYQRIIVSAAGDEIPPALLDQLDLGGALVMPVQSGFSSVMTRVFRTSTGYKRSSHGLFDFVSLM